MGLWDWATTAREGAQKGLGAVTGNLGDIAKQTIVPGLAGPLAGIPYGIGELASALSSGGGGSKRDPSASAPSTNQPATPANAGVQQWNPLAVNMFYATAIAPMLQQLAGQFNTQNQNLLKLAQNTPGQQYIPQQYQALANQMVDTAGIDANNVSKALLGAAAAGPAIDTLSNQLSTLSQRALQAYTEALRTGASTDLNSLLGPQAGSTLPSSLQQQVGAAVTAATQPTG